MKDMDKFDDYFFNMNKYPHSSMSNDIINLGSESKDMVDKPAHYTQGKAEAIDVIEDAIKDAPSTNTAFNQGQVLKYLLRLWHKGDSAQDARKARWYLNRLIEQLDT